MSHKNKKSLVRQVQEKLQQKLELGVGTSKHMDKGSQNNIMREKIYSYGTFQSYLKSNIQFVNFCKQTYGSKTLEDCRPHVNDYLQKRMQSCSSFTVQLDAASIGKLYGESTTAFCPTPPRHRYDVVRSRGEKKMDKHFSETKNAKLVEFCKATGLRRSEVAACRGTHLVSCPESLHNLGILVPSGKGGKTRVAPLCCSREVARQIIQQCQEAGEGKLFQKVHAAADIHSYRSQYASNYYSQIARDINGLQSSEKYICRYDKAGVIYDRQALRQVSKAMGHNRESVIANNYLHNLQ